MCYHKAPNSKARTLLMAIIWQNRRSSICNFNPCHFGARGGWREKLTKCLTFWEAFSWVPRCMGAAPWESQWLNWEKELKSAHEPSVHMATGFPTWAAREGRLETGWEAQSDGRKKSTSPMHLRWVWLHVSKKGESTSYKIQRGLRQLPPHCQTWATYPHCRELSCFSSTN